MKLASPLTRVRKGLLVALVQLAIVGMVGAKFQIDRATLPRVWARTVPVDPDLPIRGRYVRLNPVVAHPAPEGVRQVETLRVRLTIRDDQLAAIEDPDGRHFIRWQPCGGQSCWVLARPLAFFIPEHVPDRAVRAPGETLWVEASIPPEGPPRPLRLGIATSGAPQPLQLR